MNIQQGYICTGCGNNLRSRSLAAALCDTLGLDLPLSRQLSKIDDLRVLEINPSGKLSPFLAEAKQHITTNYPEVDIQSLPFETASFDIVLHSDVLEHVADAVQAIKECLRVADRGWVIFTTPVLADRRTRRRGRFSRPSFHGGDSGRSRVIYEFGADIWVDLANANAKKIVVHAGSYPYAIAISCRTAP